MTLTKQAKLSDAGIAIRRGLVDRLDVLRLKGDSCTNHEENLSRMGAIKEVKALLTYFDETIITQ